MRTMRLAKRKHTEAPVQRTLRYDHERISPPTKYKSRTGIMRSITNTYTTIPFLGGSPRKFEITMNSNGKPREEVRVWRFENGYLFSLNFLNLPNPHSNIQTFNHSNILTFPHSNIQTFQHSNILTFPHSNILTFQHSNTPTHPFSKLKLPCHARIKEKGVKFHS